MSEDWHDKWIAEHFPDDFEAAKAVSLAFEAAERDVAPPLIRAVIEAVRQADTTTSGARRTPMHPSMSEWDALTYTEKIVAGNQWLSLRSSGSCAAPS